MARIDPAALDEPIVGAVVAVHIQATPPVGANPDAALGELFDLSPALARFAWALAQCYAEAFGFRRAWAVFAAIGGIVLMILAAARLLSI